MEHSRSRRAAALMWGLAPVLSLAFLGSAQAHHPGSHANRQADGRVRVDVVATTADLCSAIASVQLGAPASVKAAPGSVPVTARLRREGEVCAAAVSAVRAEAVLDIPKGAKQILLYIEAPDGTLASTERVPIR